MNGAGFVFRAWVFSLSYDQAERAYREGIISLDGWTAYRVSWAFSAPRFSHLADWPRRLVHEACEASR